MDYAADVDGGPREGARPEAPRRRSSDRPRSFLTGREGGAGVSWAGVSDDGPEGALLPVNFMRKDRVFDWSRFTLGGSNGVAGSEGAVGGVVSAGRAGLR